MRYKIRSAVLMASMAAPYLQSAGVWCQGIRLNEPATNPIPIEGRPQVKHRRLPLSETITKKEVEEREAEGGGRSIASTEQVAINRTDANPSHLSSEQTVPISAVLFDGSPGPEDCRGTVILKVSLTKPGTRHPTPACYNVPRTGVAQCGNFLANKEDGCEARIFAEPDCRAFANIAVFIPEARAFGGYIRSIEVRCGVASETPPPLDLPGLELPPNAVQAVG